MQDLTFDAHRAIDSVVSQRTKSEKEEWEKYQEEQRAKVQTLDGNALLGARQIEIALKELESGDSDFEYTRLAEGYALQGDFQKALELTRDATKRAEYQSVVDASEMECPCFHREAKVNVPASKTCVGGSVRITKWHKFDSFRDFDLYRCVVCGHIKKC